MPRKFKKSKVSICVFCEGESEQAYTDFLKSKFCDVAVFKRPSSPGLFDDADNRFKKDPGYRNYVDAIDEIWFFFDVEEKDIGNWTNRLDIIKRLRKLRKDPKIRVRLLMTTGCIEYWLMLQEGQLRCYRAYCPELSDSGEECYNCAAESLTRRNARFRGHGRAKSLVVYEMQDIFDCARGHYFS